MVSEKVELQLAKRIGKALAKQRLAKKMTQEHVAELIGVEQETISRFERGASLPTLSRLIALADLYQIPLDAVVRAGSSRTLDQANDIAAMLHKLNEDDRIWLHEWVANVCKKLNSRN